MAGWRDIKAKARSNVHRAFEVPAVYLTHVAGTHVPCLVRIHSKIAQNSNEFTWPSTPGYLEIDPIIIFAASQVPKPARLGLLVVDATEIYRLDVSEPDREGYIKTTSTRLLPDECATLVGEITASPLGIAWTGILP